MKEACIKPRGGGVRIVLVVVGYWSSRRRPWKGGKDRMAVAKAFTFTVMPFVLVETATGIVSLLTGILSISPLIGAGTVIDFLVLAAGLSVFVHKSLRPRDSNRESENREFR